MNDPERRIPKRWTEGEDVILHDEARTQLATGQIKDWNRIAAKLPGRTNKDCRKRWINRVCGGLKKGAWEEAEDQRLRDAINIHGQKWTAVASLVGFRSPDQCAKRWQHTLDPRLDHEGWTEEEDELLLTMVQNYGREWKFVQDQEMPTRSQNELRNRYTTLSKRSSLTMENTENADSSSSDRSSRPADQHLPRNYAANAEIPSTNIAQIEDELAQGVSMNWENASTARFISGSPDEWLRHMTSPFSEPPTSAISFLGSASSIPSHSPQILSDGNSVSLRNVQRSPGFDWVDTTELLNDRSDFLNIDMTEKKEGTDLSEPTLTKQLTLHDIATPADMRKTSVVLMATEDEDLVGKVSLIVDQCDTSTFKHLLYMSKELRGKAKLEVGI